MRNLFKKFLVTVLTMLLLITLLPIQTFAATSSVAKSVKLSKKSFTLSVGETETLTASLSPSNASNKKVQWSSSDKKIATVTSKGKVRAIGPGDATITAKTSNGKKTTCVVTVVGYLDRMMYSNYQSDTLNNTFSLFEGNDNWSNSCKRAMIFNFAYIGEYPDEVQDSKQTKSVVNYTLAGKYDVFTCTLTQRALISTNINFKVIGDGVVLYEATCTSQTQPVKLDLSVQGVADFSIEITYSLGFTNPCQIILSDAKFEKE